MLTGLSWPRTFQWRSLVDTVMSLVILWKVLNFVASWATTGVVRTRPFPLCSDARDRTMRLARSQSVVFCSWRHYAPVCWPCSKRDCVPLLGLPTTGVCVDTRFSRRRVEPFSMEDSDAFQSQRKGDHPGDGGSGCVLLRSWKLSVLFLGCQVTSMCPERL
jgi:hypothetical protein